MKKEVPESIRIGYEYFRTEDKRRRCPCGGNYFNYPELAYYMDLKEWMIEKILSGQAEIHYCPDCQDWKIRTYT